MKLKLYQGFTLVEVLAVMAGIMILATAGIATVSKLSNNAQEQKLESDLAVLNRAAVSFVASGGDLSKAKSVEEVVSTLKKTFSDREDA